MLDIVRLHATFALTTAIHHGRERQNGDHHAVQHYLDWIRLGISWPSATCKSLIGYQSPASCAIVHVASAFASTAFQFSILIADSCYASEAAAAGCCNAVH